MDARTRNINKQERLMFIPSANHKIHIEMNSTKVTPRNERDNNKFVKILSKVLPRQNGTQAGINALAASLKRGNAYLEAQQIINDKCLPVTTTQLSNTFVKEASHV